MYTLLLVHFKWPINKVLLQSAGNSAHVMWPPGWEESWGRMDTCICVAETLSCPPETITALLTGYTPIQNTKFFFKSPLLSRISSVRIPQKPSSGPKRPRTALCPALHHLVCKLQLEGHLLRSLPRSPKKCISPQGPHLPTESRGYMSLRHVVLQL